MRPEEAHTLEEHERQFTRRLVEEARNNLAGDNGEVPDFYSEWLDGDVKKHLAFMGLARRDGDMNGILKQAELAQKAYIAKAAALYRALDDAVVRMARFIASNEYPHEELTDEELLALPAVPAGDLTVEPGIDENGEPVLFDFAKVPHLVALERAGWDSLARIVAQAFCRRDDIRFVAIGSPKWISELLPCCVPVASNPYAQSAIINWLTLEMEQRKRLLSLGAERGPALFIFADDDANSWLFDWDGLKLIAAEGGDLGLHLVITTEFSYKNYAWRGEKPTIDGLIEAARHHTSVVLERWRRSSACLYRQVTPKEYASWIERRSQTAGKPYAQKVSALQGLGKHFATGKTTVQELMEGEQRFHTSVERRRTEWRNQNK